MFSIEILYAQKTMFSVEWTMSWILIIYTVSYLYNNHYVSKRAKK